MRHAILEPMRTNIHLLMTCLVTNTRRDGSRATADRAEIFRLCIESLADVEFASASFYIEIADDVDLTAEEVQELVANLSTRVRVTSSRLEDQDSWRAAIRDVPALPSDIVMLLTYEDHILREGVRNALVATANSVASLNKSIGGDSIISILSHFPEQHILFESWRALGFSQRVGNLDLFPIPTPLGCLVALKSKLHNWFESDFSKGGKVVSTENYFGPSVIDPDCLAILPNSEIFYHYDGYSHVGLSRKYPVAYEQNRSPAGRSLIGRSRTFWAVNRSEGKAGILHYLRGELAYGGLSQLGILSSRHFGLLILAFFSPLARGISRLGIQRRIPLLAPTFAIALAHGLPRFAWIFTANLFAKLFRGPSIVSRLQGKPGE